ncbi:MAG: YeeE/YedE thiosulfate transporter family protein [candidate division WOR-3 bacterium]|nr:YeeE/YedE thiosulfate transporter family protein [candidate division WOR-3 bacterium]
MEWLTQIRWSPYIVGAGIGVLSWITFLISDKPLGCSTAFARTSGMLGKIFGKKRIEENKYFQKFVPEIDWEWMLVLGVIIGAFVSALISGDFRFLFLPSKWIAHFGNTPVLRFFVALIGGILMGFGARWAGGCTSGHGISGALQLAVSSWIAAICFFIGGIAAAFLIFRVF